MLTTKMLLLYVNYFYGFEGTSDAQPGAIKCMHMLKTTKTDGQQLRLKRWSKLSGSTWHVVEFGFVKGSTFNRLVA